MHSLEIRAPSCPFVVEKRDLSRAHRSSHAVKLSCIVPLYNCLPLTQAMWRTLQATLPPALDHEVIFVDDGSTDGTRDWLATLPATAPQVRVVLQPENRGYAAANNAGAALARGEYLALLNNDLALLPRWLEPMLVLARRLGPRAGVIGNVQRAFATGAIDHTGIVINLKGKPEHDRILPLRAHLPPTFAWRRSPAVTGACLLVNRHLFTRIGGFNTTYRNGGEDVDFAFRCALEGRINAVALRSVVRHHISASPNRKLRDEENTRRLTLAWRDTLARHAARRWCRHHLRRAWTASRDPRGEAFTAALLLAYALHLRPTPPPASLTAMHAALDRELARWRRLLDDLKS